MSMVGPPTPEVTPRHDGLRQEYTEAAGFLRHYSGLRFTMFTVYFAVLGGVSSVAFGLVKADNPRINVPYWAKWAGLVFTLVFLALEINCESYLNHFARCLR